MKLVFCLLFVLMSCKTYNHSSDLYVSGEQSAFAMATAISHGQGHLCGATVVGVNVLLTAAHCLADFKSGGVYLRDNKHNRSVQVFYAKSWDLQKLLKSKDAAFDLLGGDIAIVAMSGGLYDHRIAKISSDFVGYSQTLANKKYFIAGYGASSVRETSPESYEYRGAGVQRAADVQPTFNRFVGGDPKNTNLRDTYSQLKLLFLESANSSDLGLPGDSGIGLYNYSQDNSKEIEVSAVMSGLNMDFDQRGNLAAGRNTFVSTYSKAFHEILAQQNPQTGELCKAGICVLLENPEQALKEYFGSLNASASRFAIDWNLEEDSRPSYIEQQKTTARIKHYLVQQKKNSVIRTDCVLSAFLPGKAT